MFAENPLFLIPFLSGIVFLVAGAILYWFPPKKINGLYGYRTRRSMRSQEAWDFAQVRGGRQLALLGLALMAASCIGIIVYVPPTVGTVLGLGLMIAGVVLTLMRVEKELKARFPE